MKSVLKTVVILFATTALFSSCGHMGHHEHGEGMACGCSKEQKEACKCEKKTEAATNDGKKAECEDCKKGG